MTEQLFSMAHYADQAVLWVLIILSVLSFAIILERFFFLNKIYKDSKVMLERIEYALLENKLSDVKEMAKVPNSIMGTAAAYAVKHIEHSGDKGLEEIFNTHLGNIGVITLELVGLVIIFIVGKIGWKSILKNIK